MLTLSIIKGCPSKAVIFDKEQSFVRPTQVNPENSGGCFTSVCVGKALCNVCGLQTRKCVFVFMN